MRDGRPRCCGGLLFRLTLRRPRCCGGLVTRLLLLPRSDGPVRFLVGVVPPPGAVRLPLSGAADLAVARERLIASHYACEFRGPHRVDAVPVGYVATCNRSGMVRRSMNSDP